MNFVPLSKTISHALRHEPWVYELELDEEGWVPVDQLLESLRLERDAWKDLNRSDLEELIRTASKQRFELKGDQIRAMYGHSLPGKLIREPAAPPAVLFHGTSPKAIEAIRQSGLQPMSRQYVHLSADVTMAQTVGQRKGGKPVILRILAQQAAQAGCVFYFGNDNVWLADAVAPKWIEFGN